MVADDTKSRSLWDKGMWAALALVSAASVFGSVYTTKEARKCSQQQAEFKRELEQDRVKQQIARDEIHDILGHTDELAKMVQSQGEALQNPDYYEQSLKTQIQRTIKLGYSRLAEMNPQDRQFQALKEKIERLEGLVGNWFEREKSRKTKAQLMSEFAGHVKSAVGEILPYIALAEILQPPTPKKPIDA